MPLSWHKLQAPPFRSHPFLAVSFPLTSQQFSTVPRHLQSFRTTVYFREGWNIITPDPSHPFPSLLSFVWAPQTVFCHFCNGVFKSKNLASFGHSDSVVYLMSQHQTNCAHSTEIIPDKRRLWPCEEYERAGVGNYQASQRRDDVTHPVHSCAREVWGCQESAVSIAPAPLVGDLLWKAVLSLSKSLAAPSYLICNESQGVMSIFLDMCEQIYTSLPHDPPIMDSPKEMDPGVVICYMSGCMIPGKTEFRSKAQCLVLFLPSHISPLPS